MRGKDMSGYQDQVRKNLKALADGTDDYSVLVTGIKAEQIKLLAVIADELHELNHNLLRMRSGKGVNEMMLRKRGNNERD